MSAPTIRVYHAAAAAPLPPEDFRSLLALLPAPMGKRIERLRRWEDRHAALAGKLMLSRGMAEFDRDGKALSLVRFGPFGKPHFAPPLDSWSFSISHTGGRAVCAIAPAGLRIGIDIETVRDVPFGDFTGVFTPHEWNAINGAVDPLRAFFRYWTMKESIIKGDGRGLSLPLADVEIRNGAATAGGMVWRAQEVGLGDGVVCHVACNTPEAAVAIIEVDLLNARAVDVPVIY